MKLHIVTSHYVYVIRIELAYCGAASICRQPKPGEDWLRGSDLCDGPIWRLPWVIADVWNHYRRRGRWAFSPTDNSVPV